MLKGYKTYITAGLSILGAGIGWYTGTIDAGAAFQAIEAAVLGAFIRHGIKTGA